MKVKYFSRVQAFAVSRDFQYLLGLPLDGEHAIENVIAAPNSHILQWKYIRELLSKNAPADDMPPENPAGHYDVLLLCRTDGTERGFISQDLRTYLAAHNLPFDESRYTCLRSNKISANVLSQAIHNRL